MPRPGESALLVCMAAVGVAAIVAGTWLVVLAMVLGVIGLTLTIRSRQRSANRS